MNWAQPNPSKETLMSQIKILVVDDDPAILNAVRACPSFGGSPQWNHLGH